MSILARCPYCRRVAQAPERAVGASGKCPSCGNWYTVTPEPGAKAPPPSAAAGGDEPRRSPAAGPPGEAPPAFDPAPDFAAAPGPPVAPAPLPFRDRVHPAGLMACFLAAAALLAAASAKSAVLTWPLAAVGLLVAVAGVLRCLGRPALLLFPAAGAVLSGGVLVAALTAPGLLGPRYEASRQRSGYDPTAVQFVPLRLEPAGGPLEAGGWADASRAAVQQGTIRVQVTGAAVGPVRLVAPKPKFTKERYLTVGVRVQHLGHGGPVEYEHWGLPAARGVPPPALDAGGRRLAPVELDPEQPAGRADLVRLFPGKAVEDVLVFPAPAAPGPLRLELPAEAWGGRGAFRFQIPASMVTVQPAPKAGARSPRGGK